MKLRLNISKGDYETRDGRFVRVVSILKRKSLYCVVGMVLHEGIPTEMCHHWTEWGRFAMPEAEHPLDLMRRCE